MRIGGIINFIANQSSAKINEQLKEKGISHGEARVIHLLYHQDGLLQEKLTKLLLIDKSAVTRILKNMEEKGLIIKQISLKDKRNYEIYLTSKGRSLYSFIDQTFENVSDKMVNGLNSLEKEQLNQMLHTIAKNMEEFYE